MTAIQKNQKIIPYLFIALLAVIAFVPTVKVGFLWDDHEVIENNPAIRSINLTNVRAAFQSDVFNGKGDAYFRPTSTLLNMVDYSLWKLNPFGYHVTNILLHMGACMLLFFCLEQILEEETIALAAALMMAVHPIVVEQLLIVTGRAELLAALFTFAALALAIQKSTWAFIGSLVFFFMACLSKESGAVMPLFLALAGWFNPALRIPVRRYGAYLAVFLIYIFLRSRAVATASMIPSARVFAAFFWRDLPTILISYVRILLFPIDLHSHRRMMFHLPWMFISPALLAGFLIGSYLKRWKLGFFSSGWFLLGLAPKFPLLADNSLMLDHWAYLSGAGLFIALSDLAMRSMARLRLKSEFGLGLLILFGSFWIGLSRWNIQRRDTDYKMYSLAMQYPTSSHVHANFGFLYYEHGDYERALGLFDEALEINPDLVTAANGKALCLWKLGHRDEALQWLDEWIKKRPDYRLFAINRDLISHRKPNSNMKTKEFPGNPDANN